MNAAKETSKNLVVALSGGVGGAKLAHGLARVLAAEDLTIIVNTGDDFRHLGLHVSPDIDSVLYALAGLADPVKGWGRRDETWTFMAALATIGGETWFQLGDADLAIHVERTRRLSEGEALSDITADFCERLGIASRVLPMTDDTVRTVLITTEGALDFQDYFVRLRCEPEVLKIEYQDADDADVHPDILAALDDPLLRAVIFCPSNPFLSINPILEVGGMRDALANCAAPVVAMSPIIGGRAIKGPTAKIMNELGWPTTAAAVAQLYVDLLDGYVLDHADAQDAAAVADLGIQVIPAHTLMQTLEDREALARRVLATADALPKKTV